MVLSVAESQNAAIYVGESHFGWRGVTTRATADWRHLFPMLQISFAQKNRPQLGPVPFFEQILSGRAAD